MVHLHQRASWLERLLSIGGRRRCRDSDIDRVVKCHGPLSTVGTRVSRVSSRHVDHAAYQRATMTAMKLHIVLLW